MKLRKLPLVITLVFALTMAMSCSDDKHLITAKGVEDLGGSWLLNEHGYSPGDRYIIEAVPAVPPQVIQFHPDGKFFSNITVLADYKFFEIAFDEHAQRDYLRLYKTAEEAELKESNHSYDIQFPEGELRLSFRYCIEGCHMKFAKVKNTSTDE